MKEINNNSKTKKKTTNKRVEKKANTKQVEKKTKEKKIVEQKTTKTKGQNKFSTFIKSEKFLLIVFILLLILVIFLGVMVATTPKEKKEHLQANIVLPIIKKEESFDLSINAGNLEKEGEYIFKVINYKNGAIIKEEIPYKITIENNIGADIELIEGDSKENLITNKQKTIIEKKPLGTKAEKAIYYRLRIKSKDKYSSKDLIQLKVET